MFRTTFTTGASDGVLQNKSYDNHIKSLGNKTIRQCVLEALFCGINMKNFEPRKLLFSALI